MTRKIFAMLVALGAVGGIASSGSAHSPQPAPATAEQPASPETFWETFWKEQENR